MILFLEIIGVGYKANTNPQGSILYLKLGFSHEIQLQVTSSIHVFCFKPNPICCTGIDHQKVTQFAARNSAMAVNALKATPIGCRKMTCTPNFG